MQDPHLFFAHGGRADFRGRHGQLYNFFSAPGIAVNVKTENATFPLRRKANNLIVDGSYITEVHLAMIVGAVGGRNNPGMGSGGSRLKRKWLNVSYRASELDENNWGWSVVSGYCGGRLFKIGKGGRKTCEELVVSVVMATATFAAEDWVITARGEHSRATMGPGHRVDVSFRVQSDWAARNRPHGIFGQSYSHPGPLWGKIDVYPVSGHFTTTAMAEGAIEGNASLYEVGSPYATEFAFSRFDATPLAEASDDVLLTDGHAEAEAGAVNDLSNVWTSSPSKQQLLMQRGSALPAPQSSISQHSQS